MTRNRSHRSVLLPVVFFLAAGIPSPAHGQTETSTIYGSVTDPTGAVVPKAAVRLIDTDRGAQSEVATATTGFYSFPSVRPGRYRMDVEKAGFKLLQLTGITVNVQDNLEENLRLSVGAVSETITVEANAENVNTTDATVSTVVDNRFVENMPLNGRSFGSLLDLIPGVVLNSANFYDQGQFSVNGQRPDANYFSVDGVSANIGTNASNPGQGGAGQLPATSAFGGMSNLVSLDALQEFRVQTSTFAPEFGRTPGAQVSVVTKSGTNGSTGLHSNISATIYWMPMTGSRITRDSRKPHCGRTTLVVYWAAQSRKTSYSSSAHTRALGCGNLRWQIPTNQAWPPA